MTPAVRRAYDEATIILLRATSSLSALAVVDFEEVMGRSPYIRGDSPSPWDEVICARSDCFMRFIPSRHRIYCSRKCCSTMAYRAWYKRHFGVDRRGSRSDAARAAVAARARTANGRWLAS